MDISIVCPKFNISLVKYSVLKASFKKVKIWVIIWLWSKHKLLCNLYFSFVTHGWCDQASSIYCTIHWKATCYDSIVDEPLHNKSYFLAIFGQNFDLKIFFLLWIPFISKENNHIFGKKIHHPWTQILSFGQFFVNFHIFLQTLCRLTLNLGANAMSKKWRRKD